MTTSTATENGNRQFKNTLTLSELIDKLVQQDAHESDRAHAALALQYLSLNMDKVRINRIQTINTKTHPIFMSCILLRVFAWSRV